MDYDDLMKSRRRMKAEALKQYEEARRVQRETDLLARMRAIEADYSLRPINKDTPDAQAAEVNALLDSMGIKHA